MRVSFLIAALLVALPVAATDPDIAASVAELAEWSGHDGRIERHPATGSVRLAVRGTQAEPRRLDVAAAPAVTARRFLERYGLAFGLTGGSQLELADVHTDQLGLTRVTFRQVYRGLPVIGGLVRVHLDRLGAVRAVNGVLVPALDLEPVPGITRSHARIMALAEVQQSAPAKSAASLGADTARLAVWREGLLRGLPGSGRLVWDVEVSDGFRIREQVLVDATTGATVARIDLVHDLRRTVSQRQAFNVVWEEGDLLPYTAGTSSENEEINELIATAGDTHTFFANLSGGQFLSYDGAGAAMRSVQDIDYDECPNAFWNGSSTNFCEGMVTDDVVAHEWTHAYTDGTHDLIYQWQPGALNEAYSDIFGETVDLLNDRGGDSPDVLRTPGECSVHGGAPPARFEVTAPGDLAGELTAGSAQFNPPAPWQVSGSLAAASDGAGSSFTDACEPLEGFPEGRIALVDRGTCTFVSKVQHAEAAGAAGVVIVNNQGDGVLTMGGDSAPLGIPAVLIGQGDGDRLRAALGSGVEVTLRQSPASDASRRWLVGEDLGGAGIRDMWSPACYGDPERVSDGRYFCSEDDNGGVHTNSGVINRAYALSVDGFGPWPALGLVRASHLWWRAMSVYQVPTTDFSAHADLIELACADLVGAQLAHPMTGADSGVTLTEQHCATVAAAFDVVEARSAPSQCGFLPVLAPEPPPVSDRIVLLDEDFDSEPGWARTNQGVYGEYVPRDWVRVDGGPAGHAEDGMLYAENSVFVGNCMPGSDDQSGWMAVDTPPVTLPGGRVTLLFDHFVATEPTWDGGVLEISVDGGGFRPVPAGAFAFNPYNGTLAGAVDGNSNPLAGRDAFTGADEGSVRGSWGQSQVRLDDLAHPGATVVVRFVLGADGCNGLDGWYLDRVRIVADGAGPRLGDGRARGGN